MVAEVDGLRALQVGICGRGPVAMGVGELDKRGHQRLQQDDRAGGVRANQERQVGRDLVVTRAGGVQLAAERADQFRQPALDRHVDVLVVVVCGEVAALDLARDGVEASLDSPVLLVVEHAEAVQGARVRTRLLDVERREALVE